MAVKRPLVVAHRGGAGLRPENTLPAIEHALALGVDAVEVDVHLSADGEVIVHHDYRLSADLARLGGAWIEAPGPLVRDLAWAELRRVDVGRPRPGSSLALKHPDLMPADGARIPRLAEVIELLRPGRAEILIELKLEPIARDEESNPAKLIEATARLLESLKLIERSLAISFDWRALCAMAQRLPSLRTGYLTYPFYLYRDGPLPADAPPWAALTRERLKRVGAGDGAPARDATAAVATIRAAGGYAWGPFRDDATAGNVAAARNRGLRVMPWTANEPGDFERLVSAGADSITTDRPDRLLAFLDARGVRKPPEQG